jgi:putative transferase (TIGR04331 family)
MSKLDDTMQVRLRSSGADSFPINRLHASSAGITIDDGRQSGVAAASRAGLVIHNYLGTSWLETLAMNVPTVCFIPPDIHRFRPAAQPFADAFMRVGILHYSGVQAARFVNSLKGDPSAWWNSSEVQEARQAFVARYANFSENWLEAWMNEFERILAE